MKFTLSWLFDHLDTQASRDDIVTALTVIGLEVEHVEDPAQNLDAFSVAEIISADPHPDADRLRVCVVKSAAGEHQVVCGAPNARAGLKGIFAPEGSTIPASGMVLKKAKIRGVESRGMMCSAAELGLSDDHEGIIELDETMAIGLPAAQALGANDPIIEIAITPNRPDCLGVRGIARDLAAYGLGVLKNEPVYQFAEAGACPIAISVEPSLCPAFAGRVVSGVNNGPSPDWLAARLTAIGLRPINALVDITNYISIDRGRPLHVYDVKRLSGHVEARAGRDGEQFTALNDMKYVVGARDCVIADENGVLGLGGIMGGAASGCTDDTQTVFIESAYFPAEQIARSGRHHQIDSDARYRFERGVDPQSVMIGLDLATQMIIDICGGTPSAAQLAGTPPEPKLRIAFDPHRVAALTGVAMPDAEIENILLRLGFSVVSGGAPWQVGVPSWRPDVHGVPDLIEEVIRIYGLDHVPSVALPRAHPVARPTLTIAQKRSALARRVLAGQGLVEAVTWSFIPEVQALAFGGCADLTLANPISVELSTMRPSLLPGLVSAAQRNQARGADHFGLFEVGNIFDDLAPQAQRLSAAAVRVGTAHAKTWHGSGDHGDGFAVKRDVFAVLSAMGLAEDSLRIGRDVPPWYHPGQSGAIFRDPRTPIAFFGMLHPQQARAFDVSGDIACFEIFPDAIAEPKKRATRTKPALDLSPFPAVKRDFSFELDGNIAADTLVRAARGAARDVIGDVTIFDVFSGGGLAAGRKSVAISVIFQPKDATFTDVEIDALCAQVVAAISKATGAQLRS